jgi:peptide/nickel transport system substrate-binding protein
MTVSTRRSFLVRTAAGGVVGAAWLLAACTPAPSAAPAPATSPTSAPAATAAPKKGGTLTWALSSDPVTLAPFGISNTSSSEAKNLAYESLVRWDQDLKVQPALAESWETPDNKTYIFHLRQGVKFHSGKELD